MKFVRLFVWTESCSLAGYCVLVQILSYAHALWSFHLYFASVPCEQSALPDLFRNIHWRRFWSQGITLAEGRPISRLKAQAQSAVPRVIVSPYQTSWTDCLIYDCKWYGQIKRPEALKQPFYLPAAWHLFKPLDSIYRFISFALFLNFERFTCWMFILKPSKAGKILLTSCNTESQTLG